MNSFLKSLCIIMFLSVFTGCDDPEANDPTVELPALSIADASELEGESVVFTVTLSEASDEPVSFKYTVTHGTTSDADFDGALTETASIAPGITTLEISIALASDDEDESAETFTIALSDAENAELSNDAQATGTINNVPPQQQTGYFLKVKIDGQQWTATQSGFFFAPAFIQGAFSGYGTGSFSDSHLSFVFSETPTGAADYDVELLTGPDDGVVRIYYSPNYFSSGGLGQIFEGQPGSVLHLTKYDEANNVAEGTFSFTAKDADTNQTLQFTEGAFRVPIED